MESQLNFSDTIAAPATPTGRGALAMVRLSGKDAINIVDKVWKGKSLFQADSHTAHLGYIKDFHNPEEVLDQAVATVFKAPRTYTGEDIVELSLHGSPLIVTRVMAALIDAGARPADRGEFSRRAVANNRMSLFSAEAVADLISASSQAARRIAMRQMRGGVEQRLKDMQADLLRLASLLELELDFSEEDVEFASRSELLTLALSVQTHLNKLCASYRTGTAIKDGIPVAIIGPTNAGKSSLLNALVDEERAIVSDIHGTTRDIIEDTMELGQYLFRFMDTAGLRDTDDQIEQIGISHSHRALSKARIILLVHDATTPIPSELLRHTLTNASTDASIILLLNKIDQLLATDLREISFNGIEGSEKIEKIYISAKTGKGIDQVKQKLIEIISADEQGSGDILLTNERHYTCVTAALTALTRVISQLQPTANNNSETFPDNYIFTPDLIAQSVREVIAALSELTGDSLQTPALLQNIFSQFCIGK